MEGSGAIFVTGIAWLIAAEFLSDGLRLFAFVVGCVFMFVAFWRERGR